MTSFSYFADKYFTKNGDVYIAKFSFFLRNDDGVFFKVKGEYSPDKVKDLYDIYVDGLSLDKQNADDVNKKLDYIVDKLFS